MLKVNKMNVNLLNWMHVDLETTGQAEIHDWRKPRVVEMEGKLNEQQTVEKEGVWEYPLL